MEIDVIIIFRQMVFKWNDIHHSLTLTGEKAEKIRALLVNPLVA
jgi:hypothetical protein